MKRRFNLERDHADSGTARRPRLAEPRWAPPLIIGPFIGGLRGGGGRARWAADRAGVGAPSALAQASLGKKRMAAERSLPSPVEKRDKKRSLLHGEAACPGREARSEITG
jgi:hypothetical protein